MTQSCAIHPESSATGLCETCHRPFCARCAVEDVSADLRFCSTGCLQAPRDAGTPPRAELVEGLRHPIRTGWALWLKHSPTLSLLVGLPVGAAFGVLQATAGGSFDEAADPSLAYELGLVACVAAGASATAVLLSAAHTGRRDLNPWPLVAQRILPWSIAMMLLVAAVLAGTMLLVIPGIIAGIRLFWADEFALIHRQGPVDAVRESIELTRGLTGKIFGFQFLLGFAEYLIAVPLFLGVLAIAAIADSLPPGPIATVVSGTLMGVLLVNAYASAHAPEVVYFYGLRALRADLGPEDLHGDWVKRALGDTPGTQAATTLPTCSSCGFVWDPRDYRRDAEAIYCSRCHAELEWPD